MKIFRIVSLIWALLLLSGCASQPLTFAYSPTSTMSLNGQLMVGDFKYRPADGEKIQPNQIRNTALGKVILEKNIDQYFEDAMRLESRFVGIDINVKQPQVSGEILEFLIDDLGYSITWTLDVKYLIENCYEDTHSIAKKTGKFGDVFGELRNVMKENIELLFSDAKFQSCIQPSGAVPVSQTNQSQPQALEEATDITVVDTPDEDSSGVYETSHPNLVADIRSESEVVMRNAAKQAGESKLYGDVGIITACLERLEAAPQTEISRKQKYLIDGLAWCALNVGNARDERGNVVLAQVVASGLPKKIRNASIHALKVIRGDIPVK